MSNQFKIGDLIRIKRECFDNWSKYFNGTADKYNVNPDSTLGVIAVKYSEKENYVKVYVQGIPNYEIDFFNDRLERLEYVEAPEPIQPSVKMDANLIETIILNLFQDHGDQSWIGDVEIELKKHLK